MHSQWGAKFLPDAMKTANATLRKRPEPKWARLWPRWDSLFQTAVSGWKDLEDAVLLGDDGLSKGWITQDGLQARIRWNHYVARLPFVPLAADEVAVSYSRRWPVTANQIDRLAATWLRASLVDAIGSETFRSGVQFLLDSIALDQAESDEAIRSPVKLLKLAYAQLLKLPRRSDDGFRLAAFWLVLIGCAVDRLPYPDCKLCFRHAPHGHQYCLAHSQARAFQGQRHKRLADTTSAEKRRESSAGTEEGLSSRLTPSWKYRTSSRGICGGLCHAERWTCSNVSENNSPARRMFGSCLMGRFR